MPHDATFTLAIAAAAGVSLLVAADAVGVPSIVLLLLGGVLLGPEALGLVDPHTLGPGLETVISLAVAVILFEGGLSLHMEGFRRSPTVIRRMLSVGVLVTWVGLSAVIWLVMGWTGEAWPWPMALLGGALVIVTGPTVISPLLRRLQVGERLHHVLYWEGVLIDPIGVFIAVLCFEWLDPQSFDSALEPLARFVGRVVAGLAVGAAGGLATAWLLRRRWVPPAYANLFTLGATLGLFAGANAILHETGIVAVVASGLTLALAAPAAARRVRAFKLELTELGIAVLFILLSARLELDRFAELAPALAVIVGAAVLVVRPLNIAVSTWGQGFSLGERAFLAWMAPRGIVAASMASLFATRLTERGVPEAVHLETITYAIIVFTVGIQGLASPWVARLLGVGAPEPGAWLIVAPRAVGQGLVRALRQAGVLAVSSPHALPPSTLDNEAMGAGGLTRGARGGDVTEVLGLGPGGVTAESGLWRDLDEAEGPLESGLTALQPPRVERVLCACPGDEAAAHEGRADAARRAEVARAWGTRLGPDRVFSWRGGQRALDPGATRAGVRLVWDALPDPQAVEAEVEAGRVVFGVVGVGSEAEPDGEPGRFGEDLLPLFWVSEDGRRRADLVTAPRAAASQGAAAAGAAGGLAVVMRRPVLGLHGLVRDVVLMGERGLGLADVVPALLEVAAQDLAARRLEARGTAAAGVGAKAKAKIDLDLAGLARTILEREALMPTVVGGGVAIPHAYVPGAVPSRAYVAIIPRGAAAVAGPAPQDNGAGRRPGEPLRFVALVLSAPDHPEAHLQALAALASVTSDGRFLGLLTRQRSPDRVRRLLEERA